MLELRGVQRQEGHKGKAFVEVGLRQQQRLLKEMREKAQKAFWFSETYGLKLKSLEMEDTTGRPVNLNFNSDTGVQEVNDVTYTRPSHKPESTSAYKTYETLDAEEKEKLKTILFIMDRFSISLEGYHELSQAHPSLPKKYLVESCAKFLDDQWDVKRTPGQAQGAELPLRLLLDKEIRQHRLECCISIPIPEASRLESPGSLLSEYISRRVQAEFFN
ncbi:uncharacterized protein [Montipora foliosa]|uniref:uncharacterized protein n=1 Tax=Montipora foliosa TaxID=591990 RepID=UPI0035F137DC